MFTRTTDDLGLMCQGSYTGQEKQHAQFLDANTSLAWVIATLALFFVELACCWFYNI